MRALPYAPYALLALAAGLIHRQAAPNPWGDDRLLAAEPSWFQMAAPLMHAAVPGSWSLSSGLTQLIDPLTRASTAGDIRALAALATALTAALMFVFLRRHGTPAMLALPLSCSILTVVLPVSSAMTAALALQMLLAVTLLLIASPVSPRVITTPRLAALAAITVIGVINHAAFLPFAAVVWLAAVWDARGDAAGARRPIPMTGLLMTGLLALVAGLTMTAWLMHLDAAAPLDLAGGRPGIVTLAIGLITGRFAPDLQPAAANPGGLSGLRAALAHLVPGPVIVWFPLAGLAWMRRETRAAATLLASAAAAVWLFSARTWLPDLEVAYAQANVTLALLAGLGLTWLAAQPIRDAKLTAILAAIVIGVNGAFAPERFGVDLHTARLQAFVESVSPSINVGFWTSERLAIDRALLIQRVRGPRVPAQPDVLAALSDDRPLVVFANARARLERDGAWAASFDVPYRSAASLLASLPDGTWLAVARHDDRDDPEADSFFDDLFARWRRAGPSQHRIGIRIRGDAVCASRRGARVDRARRPRRSRRSRGDAPCRPARRHLRAADRRERAAAGRGAGAIHDRNRADCACRA